MPFIERCVVSKYIVLGTDECDAEKQRDLWLKEHPGIKINRIHRPKREPPNLLTRFGSRKSLRVSILIDFALPEAAEYKKLSDIAEQQFKELQQLHMELQQLRMQVYKAELDFYDRAMSNRRPMARGPFGPRRSH
jgi:hypothetical protein